MHRTLKDLDKVQQAVIDLVHVQMKKYPEAANELDCDVLTISRIDKDLRSRWQEIAKIRDKWKVKKIGGNFWDFCHWFMTTERCCHYCGITQDGLDELHAIGINNKRTTRGRSLEIDRKVADEPYSNLNNLVYSCYWCNNAKTDTFTEEEFKIIGRAIGTVWQQRLK
jgi:5-methylcytosine-specific restriction endonuclease McrA